MNSKFDPSWKESPDLPGEIYDDHAICGWCHENIPLDQICHAVTNDDEDVFCPECAGYLEASWELFADRQEEDKEYERQASEISKETH